MLHFLHRSTGLVCAGLVLLASAASAQQTPNRTAAERRSNSDIIVKAVRIATPINVDGRLDDEVYQTIEPIAGFVQQEPHEGEAISERTESWVMFDDKNLYVSAKCYDSHPERQVVTELRRDNGNIFQNESYSIAIDTFRDLRNGFMFQTNAIGGMRDLSIVDEATGDSWNTIWDVRTQRYDWGWSVEFAVPFKSLRYPGPGPQVWGINLRRVIKYKNEYSYLTPMAASFGVSNSISRMGEAATLVDLETPRQSMNLELKPYVTTSITTDHAGANPFDNDTKASAGFDFKYGLTRGLTLDTTVNTDFAQVEEDQQQVNLTRFSLFFPEKRDFFLEGQGVFAFGGVAAGNNGNPGEVPILFFSRQIGLSKGQSVPVVAGGRVTGRTGKYQIGAVNIQTENKAEASAVSTNFTAFRLKRDILRRSNIGLLGTFRSPTVSAAGNNNAIGADANFFLFRNVTANACYARTNSPGRASSGEASYRGRFEFSGDRWGWTAEHLLIGAQFTPEIGYVRRTDFRRSYGEFRFSPRPKNNKVVRKYSYTGSYDFVTTADASRVDAKQIHGIFNTDYQSGDTLNVDFQREYEFLPSKFTINPGTVVPAGGYDYQSIRVQYTLGQQRKVSGRLFTAYGSLYDGKKTEAGYGGRIGLIPQFALEPSISLNWVRLPFGDFEAPVISSRIIFTPNARTALSSYLQYNGGSHTMSSSVRLRWEYRGGSELFIVYSDGRNTLSSGYPELLNRSFAVKVTRLLRL